MRPLGIALFAVLFAQTASAQIFPVPVSESRGPNLSDQWVLSGSAFGGIPVGEFRKHENGGGGVELMLGFQPWRRQPLIIRGDFAVMQYGVLRQRGQQQVCDAGGSCWIEDVTFNAREHSMYFWHIGPEFMATDGKYRPFVFALAGATVFSSKANLAAACPTCTQPPTQSLFSSNNVSSAYGLGVRRVTTWHGREHGFELSTRVTRNAESEYLTEDGVQHNADGTWTVTPRRGAANVLGIHLGYWMGPHILRTERR